jgi:hypothetical protein
MKKESKIKVEKKEKKKREGKRIKINQNTLSIPFPKRQFSTKYMDKIKEPPNFSVQNKNKSDSPLPRKSSSLFQELLCSFLSLDYSQPSHSHSFIF